MLPDQLALSAIDRQFSAFLARQAQAPCEPLRLAVALLSQAVASGHVCLDLREVAGRTMIIDGQPLLLPALAVWQEALQRSGVVGTGDGPLQPLVLTPAGRVRYPDVKVACSEFDPSADHVDPVVVFEVLSPTTEMTDRRVKSAEYASIAGVMAYVLIAQDRPAATVLRRDSAWEPEELAGPEAVLDLPEIGVAFQLAELHPDTGAA